MSQSLCKGRIGDTSIVVYILVILFGVASWVDVNGLWVELPVLVQRLPEGWDLPSYMAVIIQVANVAPLIYTIVSTVWPHKKIELPVIYVIISVGAVSCFLLAFFWHKTSSIEGTEHSTALLVLQFFLALVDCTSSVAFLPFMSVFKPQYMIAYFIGEGCSGLIPSLLSLAQGAGSMKCVTSVSSNTTTTATAAFANSTPSTTHTYTHTTTDNDTSTSAFSTISPNETSSRRVTAPEIVYSSYPTYQPPKFTVQTFFLFLMGLMILSLVSFTLLNYWSFCQKEYVVKRPNYTEEDAEEEDNSTLHPYRHHHPHQEEEDYSASTPMTTHIPLPPHEHEHEHHSATTDDADEGPRHQHQQTLSFEFEDRGVESSHSHQPRPRIYNDNNYNNYNHPNKRMVVVVVNSPGRQGKQPIAPTSASSSLSSPEQTSSSSTPASIVSFAGSSSTASADSDDPKRQLKKKISPTKYAMFLLITAWVNALVCGVLPSIQTYSCLPYGIQAYHLSVTLASISNPVACFAALFLAMTSTAKTLLLTLVGSALSGYLLLTAATSPAPPLVDHPAGSLIVILAWVVLVFFLTYIKVSVAMVFRQEGRRALLWVGAITQVGSLLGALSIFFVINYYKLFQWANPCA